MKKDKRGIYTNVSRQLINECLQESNVTIQELAEMTNIPHRRLKLYFDGKNDIDAGAYLAICDFLGIIKPSLIVER